MSNRIRLILLTFVVAVVSRPPLIELTRISHRLS